MGEPSQTAPMLSLPPDNLEVMVKREFPNCTISEVNGGWAIATLHGVGETRTQAMESALKDFHDMKRNAKGLDQMLDDVRADLAARGYSKDRHDWAIDILTECRTALADAVLTGIHDPIQIPHYTREIENLVHRADTRLNMMAVNFQQEQEARKRAGQTFKRPTLGGADAWNALVARAPKR
jgi:hypothetical protein